MPSNIVPIDTIRTEPDTLDLTILPMSESSIRDFLNTPKYSPPHIYRLGTIPEEHDSEHVILYGDYEDPAILEDFLKILDSYLDRCSQNKNIQDRFKEPIINSITESIDNLTQNNHDERAFLTRVDKNHEGAHRLHEVIFHIFEQHERLRDMKNNGKIQLPNKIARKKIFEFEHIEDAIKYYGETLAMITEIDNISEGEEKFGYNFFISNRYPCIERLLGAADNNRQVLFENMKEKSITMFEEHDIGYLIILTRNPDILDQIAQDKISFDEFNQTLDTNFDLLFADPVKFFKGIDVIELRNQVYFKLAKKVVEGNKILDLLQETPTSNH